MILLNLIFLLKNTTVDFSLKSLIHSDKIFIIPKLTHMSTLKVKNLFGERFLGTFITSHGGMNIHMENVNIRKSLGYAIRDTSYSDELRYSGTTFQFSTSGESYVINRCLFSQFSDKGVFLIQNSYNFTCLSSNFSYNSDTSSSGAGDITILTETKAIQITLCSFIGSTGSLANSLYFDQFINANISSCSFEVSNAINANRYTGIFAVSYCNFTSNGSTSSTGADILLNASSEGSSYISFSCFNSLENTDYFSIVSTGNNGGNFNSLTFNLPESNAYKFESNISIQNANYDQTECTFFTFIPTDESPTSSSDPSGTDTSESGLSTQDPTETDLSTQDPTSSPESSSNSWKSVALAAAGVVVVILGASIGGFMLYRTMKRKRLAFTGNVDEAHVDGYTVNPQS